MFVMGCFRPYLELFRRKLTARDKRRIAKNKALKKHQMVKKSICKTTGRVVVSLGLVCSPIPTLGGLSFNTLWFSEAGNPLEMSPLAIKRKGFVCSLVTVYMYIR